MKWIVLVLALPFLLITGTLLHACSSSRIGKGDLAADRGHILSLFSEVGRFVSAS
jgi:hypothetical protein